MLQTYLAQGLAAFLRGGLLPSAPGPEHLKRTAGSNQEFIQGFGFNTRTGPLLSIRKFAGLFRCTRPELVAVSPAAHHYLQICDICNMLSLCECESGKLTDQVVQLLAGLYNLRSHGLDVVFGHASRLLRDGFLRNCNRCGISLQRPGKIKEHRADVVQVILNLGDQVHCRRSIGHGSPQRLSCNAEHYKDASILCIGLFSNFEATDTNVDIAVLQYAASTVLRAVLIGPGGEQT